MLRIFLSIQNALGKSVKELLNLDIDFTDEGQLTQQAFDDLVGIDPDDPPTVKDYVENLISSKLCDVWETLPQLQSPFSITTKREMISLNMMTQFFFSTVGGYCYSHNLSRDHFGNILDEDSPSFAQNIVDAVKGALQNGSSVEKALLDFY